MNHNRLINSILKKLFQANENGDEKPVIFLESQDQNHPSSRSSYIAAYPEMEVICKGSKCQIRKKNGEMQIKSGDPWQFFREFRNKEGGWWFGYLAYDLKNHIENLISENPDPVDAPDLYMMKPGVVIHCDHQTGELAVLEGDFKIPAQTTIDQNEDWSISDFQIPVDRNEYIRMIRESQDHIYEGDFYEINLSHQLTGNFTGSPFGLYKRIRKNGAVPFGAFLKVDDLAVCSASPERFLQKRGSKLISQPIKGTAPRHGDPALDIKNRKELLNEKNLAENLMIVDLVRHDLSKVSVEGSVQVKNLFEIQSFKTVHQLLSTVEAEARQDIDPVEIVKACFPMGSMTGAPKVSVMKAIDRLEKTSRGIYSGCIGYFSPENDFDFNVVIRTAIVKHGKVWYSAGGAITSDSDPAYEWEETLLKAKALTDVLGSADLNLTNVI